MMEKLKALLHKMFWIDKFEGKDKLLSTVAKFFMYFYIIVITVSLISAVISIDLGKIARTIVGVIVIPIIYRLVIWIHRAMRGL